MKNNLYYNGFTIPKETCFLIIDDDSSIADMVVDELELIGFTGTFKVAYDLKQAQDELRKEEIQYILCDWNLPDGEGIELLEAARKSNKYGSVPFVMITGNNNVDDMLKSKFEGISEYLVKPWYHDEFKDKLFWGWVKEKTKAADLLHELNLKNIQLEKENHMLKEENNLLRNT